MTTEHLHRDMAEEVIRIGEEIEPQIDALMQDAFDRAMALTDLGHQRHHDALSLAFQLSAVMAAKATILLADQYPQADLVRVWSTAMTDLQMRAQPAIQQLLAARESSRGSVQ